MKKYGEILLVVIIESYQSYDANGYLDLCTKYGYDVSLEDVQSILEEMLERKYLKVNDDEDGYVMNFEDSYALDQMAFELSFDEEVKNNFIKVINQYPDIEKVIDYMPEISELAFNKRVLSLMD